MKKLAFVALLALAACDEPEAKAPPTTPPPAVEKEQPCVRSGEPHTNHCNIP